MSASATTSRFRPQPQRVLALVLVVIEAGMLAYLTGAPLIPVVLVVAAAFATFSQRRFELSRNAAVRVVVWAALFFLIKHLVAPLEYRESVMFIRTELAAVIAQYVLALQTGWFFVRTDDDRLPVLFPGFGVVVLVCAADVQVTEIQRVITQGLSVSYILFAALFLCASRTPADVGNASERTGGRSAGIAAAVVIAFVALVGWTTASSLYRHERDIEHLIVDLLEGESDSGRLGYSERARLGNVVRKKTDREDRVALRIRSKGRPGYLRGKVFELYTHSEWLDEPSSIPLSKTTDLPPLLEEPEGEEFVTFVRSDAVGDSGQSRFGTVLDVHPMFDSRGRIFAPLGTTHVQAPVEQMLVGRYGTFESPELAAGQPYRVLASSAGEVYRNETGETLSRLKTLPVGMLTQDVERLAADLFAGLETNAEKIDAVVRYFHENYEYQLGISPPVGRDPVTWFLLERPPAHCEYFASGAAVLLRLGGVPCRYVTGFVSAEYNRYGDYWVARNRDAHAWVEAWDEELGWRIVEATPSRGVPFTSPKNASAWSQMLDYLQDRIHSFRAKIERGGLKGVGAMVLDALFGWLGATLLAAAAFWIVRNRWRRTGDAARVVVVSPMVQKMQPLLNRVDAQLRKIGIERATGETLHHFASRLMDVAGDREAHSPEDRRRLESAADWYREYATQRYAGEIETAALQELQEKLESIAARRVADSRFSP